MAVTVQQLYEGIRAGVGAPTGVLLTDVTRILAYANEAVRQYAVDAPESVKDMAVLQIGQYLYDAPVAARRSPANVLAESGAWAMLAPYREHRAVVLGDVAEAVERGVGGGLSEEEILALIAPWAQAGSTERIPSDHLPAAGSLTLTQVRRAVLDDPEIVGFREFEQSLRHTTTLAAAVRVQIDTPFTGVALQGASNWPVATVDREFTLTVGDVTSPEIDYSVLEAAGHVVSVGSFLSTANAVGVTIEGVEFFIGRTATRQIVFTAGTFGTYTVTITDSVIDLKDAARLSGPPLPMGGGGGLDTSAVDVRIRSLVSPVALRASLLRWASNRLALASEAAEGAVELATTIEMNEGNLTRVPTAARVKAFVEAQADVLGYARTSKRTEVFGAFTGDGWEVSDDTTEAGLHATLLTTANPVISGLVLDIKGSFEQGVRLSNTYLLLRLAKTETLTDWRLNIEGRAPIPLTTTTAGLVAVSSTSTTYDFYTYSVGDYPADSTFAIEHFVPFELDHTKVANTPSPWAIRGNDQAIPEAKLGDIVHPAIRELNNLPIGLAVTSTSAVAASRLTAFTNDLDLDDDPNGDIIVVATASTTTGSAFGIVASTDSDSDRETMNAFASEVSALPDHNFRQPTVTALRIGGFNVIDINGATIGTCGVYLGHDANNAVGYLIAYGPVPGHTGSDSGTIQINIRAMFIRSQASAAAPVTVPVYNALSQLPSSGLTVGQRAIVQFGTTAVAEFFAVSATQWLCISGSTNNLFTGNINVITARRWVATTYTLDARFPYHMFRPNIHDTSRSPNIVYRNPIWYRLSTFELLGLTASSAGAAQSDANSRALFNNSSRDTLVSIGFGRTAANVLLVTSDSASEDPWPMQIRGSA